MIGFDIDGVIREFPENYNNFQSGDWYKYIANALPKIIPEVITPGEFVLITATKLAEEQDVAITVQWLKEKGICPKDIYWLDGSRNFMSIVKHKAGIINRLGITDFYEDDPNIVKQLVKRCPLCRMHYVPSNYAKVMEMEKEVVDEARNYS